MGDVGEYTAIGVRDDDGIPVIAYHDAGNGTLKLAICGAVDCTATQTLLTLYAVAGETAGVHVDMIDELQMHALAGRRDSKEQQELPIELITTPDVGRLVYQQIYQSAEQEILGLVRPPLLYSVLSLPPDSSAQQAVHARGVRHRSISDAEMLSIPGFPERLRADVEAGEEARLMTSVPFKMVLVDRRIALMFLHPDQANSPSLVVRYSALLDALHTLFEILWERASSVSFARSGELQRGSAGSRLSKEDEELVWMMAIGMMSTPENRCACL